MTKIMTRLDRLPGSKVEFSLPFQTLNKSPISNSRDDMSFIVRALQHKLCHVLVKKGEAWEMSLNQKSGKVQRTNNLKRVWEIDQTRD